MIPPSFDYHCPTSVSEAVALLSKFGGEAKILAGGHSLLPMMKLRFAEPANLIDINKIPELRGIKEEGGLIKIGAMTTENQILFSDLLQKKIPLLPEAAKLIADPQVRNRGTIGGDIAHGDRDPQVIGTWVFCQTPAGVCCRRHPAALDVSPCPDSATSPALANSPRAQCSNWKSGEAEHFGNRRSGRLDPQSSRSPQANSATGE